MNRCQYFIFLFFVYFILLHSGGFFSNEGPSHDANLHAIDTWRDALHNLTFAGNATRPTYPEEVQRNLTRLLAVTDQPHVYYESLSASFRGPVNFHNLTGPNATASVDANGDDGEATFPGSPNGHEMRLELKALDTTDKSVARITGSMLLRRPTGLDGYRLNGFHFRRNGTMYLTAAEHRNITDLLEVVKVMPTNATFATAQNLTTEVYTQRLLEAMLVTDEYDDSEELNSTTRCRYDTYIQLTPVSKGIDHSALAELEEELRRPTGQSTIPMPALTASLLMYSPACGTQFTTDPNAPLTGLKAEYFETQSIRFAGLAIVVGFLHVLATIRQLDHTLTPSGIAKVAYGTVSLQTLTDAYILVFLLSLATASARVYLAFTAAAFFTFSLASTFEMRYLLIIWKVQQPESGGPAFSEGQIVGPLYLRFASYFMAGLALIYLTADLVTDLQRFTLRAFIVVLFSFWWPQIYRNVRRGSSHALDWRYIGTVSVGRLFYPLYAFGCPVSIFSDHVYPEVYYLVPYVALQVFLLAVQDYWGARFFLPARCLPPTYNYHPLLPPLDAEAAAGGRGGEEGSSHGTARTCAICMLPVDTSAPPSQLLGRTVYMVTPCHHIFHTDCLQTWIRTKLECPVCRAPLPPV
ncbi:hypothetical protein IWQ60_000451 [Tieghemiomyces parasiticus]|uniref:RING-type E3 ubiquitin transferase n=1 Tax=Tieghemiomyces parasiticus TaxID=78921 RepID=A0A9W8AM87_9FUNG|nr:hypothetical protein IWQ60_000451 [Tieghemiomyces parasiticus]